MKHLWLFIFLFVCRPILAQKPIDVDAEFATAAKHYEAMLKSLPDTTRFPQSTLPDGKIRLMPSSWWCSGFFGGSLWYLYERTGEQRWKDAAHLWSMAVAKEQYNTRTHDLGFMLYCPLGNGYRLTKNPVYRQIMLRGAQSLATRYRPDYGVIKSWDGFKDREGQRYEYPVIIDNMMNLEFLFWAARESGNKEFYNLSVTHADNTMKNHYRPDASSYHVILYGDGGKVLAKKTHQGAEHESAWARGQAWGLYGYVTMYRETKDKKYLNFARRIADFLLNNKNLPADKIPYWDFSRPGEERDASAGAIMASALLELSTYGGPAAKNYFKTAETMLQSLSTPAYKAAPGENNNFILKHSVGHKPGNSEIDTPLIYADYYYLEALLRYDALRKKAGKA